MATGTKCCGQGFNRNVSQYVLYLFGNFFVGSQCNSEWWSSWPLKPPMHQQHWTMVTEGHSAPIESCLFFEAICSDHSAGPPTKLRQRGRTFLVVAPQLCSPKKFTLSLPKCQDCFFQLPFGCHWNNLFYHCSKRFFCWFFNCCSKMYYLMLFVLLVAI